MFIRIAVLIITVLMVACSNNSSETSVFTEAIDYAAFPNVENCKEERVRDVRYYQCKSSRDIYEAALANAKAQGKPLMVTFGFNTCPYCKVLDMEIYDPANPITAQRVTQYLSREAASELTDLSILTVRIHARSEHGLKLADELGVTQMANIRGWHRVWSPFVVFVNPETGAMASESLWEANEIYCDWAANIAVSFEKNGMVERGKPQIRRERCPKV